MFTCCTGYYLVVLSQYGSVLVGTWWYWVNITYNLVLLGIKWNWVSVGLLCLYILKNMEIYSDVTIEGQQTNELTNDEQGKIELLSQWTMEG